MRIRDVVPLLSILWEIGLTRAESGDSVSEQFSCYKCHKPAGESCHEIDRTCSFPYCAKIKYKDDDNKIMIFRECSPKEGAVAEDICNESEALIGKPCDAWLCDTPLCNGAEQTTPIIRINSAAQTLMSAFIVLTYFLLYG